MSTELKSQTIPASGELVVSQTANFFFLLTATVAVEARFQEGGTTYGAVGVSAGYVKGKVKPWDRAVIKGTAGATVTYFIGTEELREDITDFRQQIATIAGIVAVSMQPASSFTGGARATIATAAHVDIAANLSRRRITIYNWSAGGGGALTVRDETGTTDAGAVIEAGTYQTFEGTYALRLRNNSGVSLDYSTFEE